MCAERKIVRLYRTDRNNTVQYVDTDITAINNDLDSDTKRTVLSIAIQI